MSRTAPPHSDLQTLSINTIAQLCDRSRRWVYDQMAAGLLEYKYIAGARRVYRTEFERFLADHGNKR